MQCVEICRTTRFEDAIFNTCFHLIVSFLSFRPGICELVCCIDASFLSLCGRGQRSCDSWSHVPSCELPRVYPCSINAKCILSNCPSSTSAHPITNIHRLTAHRYPRPALLLAWAVVSCGIRLHPSLPPLTAQPHPWTCSNNSKRRIHLSIHFYTN